MYYDSISKQILYFSVKFLASCCIDFIRIQWRNAKMSDAVNIYEKIFHLSLRNFNVGRHTYHLILIKTWPKILLFKIVSIRNQIFCKNKFRFDTYAISMIHVLYIDHKNHDSKFSLMDLWEDPRCYIKHDTISPTVYCTLRLKITTYLQKNSRPIKFYHVISNTEWSSR